MNVSRFFWNRVYVSAPVTKFSSLTHSRDNTTRVMAQCLPYNGTIQCMPALLTCHTCPLSLLAQCIQGRPLAKWLAASLTCSVP